jgi:hypothetical protein
MSWSEVFRVAFSAVPDRHDVFRCYVSSDDLSADNAGNRRLASSQSGKHRRSVAAILSIVAAFAGARSGLIVTAVVCRLAVVTDCRSANAAASAARDRDAHSGTFELARRDGRLDRRESAATLRASNPQGGELARPRPLPTTRLAAEVSKAPRAWLTACLYAAGFLPAACPPSATREETSAGFPRMAAREACYLLFVTAVVPATRCLQRSIRAASAIASS